MNQNSLSKHLDKTVVRLFLLISFMSASVFAYKYNQYEPCKGISFDISSKSFMEGELVEFTDLTSRSEKWEWDFGDSTAIAKSSAPLHIYKKPGEYTVSLLVNDICEHTEVVVIKGKVRVLDSTKIPQFELPKSMFLDEELEVKYNAEGVSTWEWRFGETARLDATDSIAKYKFNEIGKKTVSLIINGDNLHISKKEIEVMPKPINIKKPRIVVVPYTSPPLPVIKDEPKVKVEVKKEVVVPFISEAEFIRKLELISVHQETANVFSPYFCNNLNRTITVNDEPYMLLDFCEFIKDKKIKIKDLRIIRNETSGCVTSVTISKSKFK